MPNQQSQRKHARDPTKRNLDCVELLSTGKLKNNVYC